MIIVKAIVKEPLLVDVLFIILAMPVGSMVAMFAEQYCEDGNLASKGVALTTVLSVLTISLLSQLPFL
jgi:predicted permease